MPAGLRSPLAAPPLPARNPPAWCCSISVDLEVDGRTHASYVPIHPTAAAAAVLQNNPVVVVRQDK